MIKEELKQEQEPADEREEKPSSGEAIGTSMNAALWSSLRSLTLPNPGGAYNLSEKDRLKEDKG